MLIVQEGFSYKPMTASGPIIGLGGGIVAGFVATVSGSIKITEGTVPGGNTVVDTLPVTAGVFVPLPFISPIGVGMYATLSGGAQGTFAVN